jgi:type IV pilus assembly protein PilQ
MGENMKISHFSQKKWVFFVFILLFAIALPMYATTRDQLTNQKVSLDADDANLSAVLTTLSKLSNTNIVLAVDTSTGGTDKDKNADKRITVHLKDVPIENAISLVAKSVGLSYRLIGDNTFIVGDKARIAEETGERSYTLYLNNINCDKLAKSFALMPGKIVPLSEQNAVIIRANPETFNEILARIQELDIPQKQIEIRARVIEVSIQSSKQYGIDWSKLNHLTTILAEDPMNGSGIGLPYNYNTSYVDGSLPHGDPLEFELLPKTQYFQKMTGWDDVGHFSRQLTAFDITMDWLLENNAAKLLTDTRITAMNGEDADILIGEVVPFVVTNNVNQVQVERQDVGIKLKVKATVNKDGQITMAINPEVSSVLELVGGYVPRTKIRRVHSTVTVPDGRKIIVGGLLNSNLSQKTSKLPLLSDIPFIGKLFQHRYEVLDNTDLIIEITPRLVDMNTNQKEVDIDPRLEEHLIQYKD